MRTARDDMPTDLLVGFKEVSNRFDLFICQGAVKPPILFPDFPTVGRLGRGWRFATKVSHNALAEAGFCPFEMSNQSRGLSASSTRRAAEESLPSAATRSTQWAGMPFVHLAGLASGSGVRYAISKPHRVGVPGLR